MAEPLRLRGRLASQPAPVDVVLRDGRLERVDPASGPARGALGGDDCLVAEGFFDIQVNGFAGVDFNTPGLTPEALRRAMLAMRRTGTTRFLVTVVTAALPAMEGAMRAVVHARQADPELAHAIPGIHLEGPFLAPEDGPRGAHPAAWIRDPDWEVFCRLQEAGGGLIRLVTLAPERPGAEALIRQLCQAGITVAIGHTNAGEADLERAAAAGARLSTHLGNGAHAVLPRHRNYIQKQLAMDGLAASLICDGHHLPSYVVRNMLRCKGPGRVILVTDAMAAAAAAPGNYRLGEVLAEVGPDGYVRLPGTPYLAGSALTMERAVENCSRFAGLALEQTAAMASRRPRELLGVPGGIAVGTPADLVLLRPGPPLTVVATIANGQLVYSADG
ncbi:MAG: N-acetylglucosamine-6-phosphate deacetylase [Candidatus Methylomirabilales bacterium]